MEILSPSPDMEETTQWMKDLERKMLISTGVPLEFLGVEQLSMPSFTLPKHSKSAFLAKIRTSSVLARLSKEMNLLPTDFTAEELLSMLKKCNAEARELNKLQYHKYTEERLDKND